jgi:hypothetical protein
MRSKLLFRLQRRPGRCVFLILALVPVLIASLLVSCGEDSRQNVNPVNTSQVSTRDIEQFRAMIQSGEQPRPSVTATTEQKVLPAIAPTPAPARLLPPPAPATIEPEFLDLTIPAGQCTHITKKVVLPGERLSRADILFVVDRTGSMVEEIDQIKLQVAAIATQLSTMIDDPAFGLVSHMDYPASYDYCGYANMYGDAGSGDLPYILNQPIDTDASLTTTAASGLTMGYGVDNPESYARVLYETATDPAIGWRAGSRRIVVEFGDNIPHDCDVGACISQPLGSMGIDPGRDGVAGTADDLPILNVMHTLATANITLIYINSAGVANTMIQDLWQCWAAITGPGGVSVPVNEDGTVPGGIDLAQLIFERVGTVAQYCRYVTLRPTPGYESWVKNLDPPGYANVELPATLTFTLDICPPVNTPPQVALFRICAFCGDEVVACERDRVIVPRGFFTGGGWIDGPEGGKATFGFNAGYKCDSDVLTGELQYVDHALKGKLHATSVDHFRVFDGCCAFDGLCKVNNQPGFSYEVRACDNGEPGRDDVFAIIVFDSAHNVIYSAKGLLQGGNIQKHDCPPRPLPQDQGLIRELESD